MFPGQRSLTRRELLWNLGGGLGGVALAHLLGHEGLLADTVGRPRTGDLNGGLHHPARVRRVVQLFMNGGVSQVDTFDYKPLLDRQHGQAFNPGGGQRVEAVTSTPGAVLKSPFPFRQHGQCGRWVSSVFPHLARHVDDMAFMMSVVSRGRQSVLDAHHPPSACR